MSRLTSHAPGHERPSVAADAVARVSMADRQPRTVESTRLWGWLTHPTRRDPPLKGFDLVGGRVRGALARRRSIPALAARAASIVRAAAACEQLTEEALSSKIAEARERVLLARNERGTIDAVAPVIYEVVRRCQGVRLHPEQVMGGVAMAEGYAVEMATGEGKTFTAIMPATIDGWLGRGVHVITVNDYLAKRDASTTSLSYHRLGLSVGAIEDSTKPEQRRRAYMRDITYAADKQVVFDYLRDRLKSPTDPRMVSHLLDSLSPDRADHLADAWSNKVVQRGLFSAIIDEADSVLIDEAITPAVISADTDARAAQGEVYKLAASLARDMSKDRHYRIDRRLRKILLTEEGRGWLAERAHELPSFWRGPRRREEIVTQALSAKELYTRDDEYVIVEGKIQIVDASTGRMLPGRQWQLGLHQAVEAKEGLEVTESHRTSSRISYQRFFQRYQRLTGMSGTLWEVRHELWATYELPILRIPTHKPIARKLLKDRVFVSSGSKMEAAAKRAQELASGGRPVLIGTRSVAASEMIAGLLQSEGHACAVLNAVREEEEAAIIAQAGRSGSITVATNMAGRGTDILLDQNARAAGGLAVIATERHDEARVDRQLFGRAGRQGDPGLAQAMISLDDAVIVKFGLRPLVRLVRALPPGVRDLPASLLWAQSRLLASRRAAVVRAEVAKADAWMDMAIHSQSR